MSIDHSDTIGWPAEALPVHHEPGWQGNARRSSSWREREQARRRQRYATARAADASWREAAKFAHRGGDAGQAFAP